MPRGVAAGDGRALPLQLLLRRMLLLLAAAALPPLFWSFPVSEQSELLSDSLAQ